MAEAIYIRVNPRHIHYVNRIMEGYEYLGVVSTVDRAEGILIIRVTPDTFEDVKLILENLPVDVEFILR